MIFVSFNFLSGCAQEWCQQQRQRDEPQNAANSETDFFPQTPLPSLFNVRSFPPAVSTPVMSLISFILARSGRFTLVVLCLRVRSRSAPSGALGLGLCWAARASKSPTLFVFDVDSAPALIKGPQELRGCSRSQQASTASHHVVLAFDVTAPCFHQGPQFPVSSCIRPQPSAASIHRCFWR